MLGELARLVKGTIFLVGERRKPLSRVFNDQPRGIYIYGGIRTGIRFYYACACTHERLLLDRNLS